VSSLVFLLVQQLKPDRTVKQIQLGAFSAQKAGYRDSAGGFHHGDGGRGQLISESNGTGNAEEELICSVV
jgi:hypothetical protein